MFYTINGKTNGIKCNFDIMSVPFLSRLGVLANPEAVVSRPVAQLSIPINDKFVIVRGM